MSAKVTFVNGGKTPAWHFQSSAAGIIGKTPESGQIYPLETGWHDLHNTFFRTNDSHTFEYKHHMFRHSPQLQKAIDAKDSYIFMIIKIHYEDFRKKVHHRDFRLVWDAQYRNFRDYDAQKENCKKCTGS